MSDGFRLRWTDGGLESRIVDVLLDEPLRELIDAPLVGNSGSSVLAPLSGHLSKVDAFEDTTAYEAFTNKLHVEDFVDLSTIDSQKCACEKVFQQGSKAAFHLARRLEREPGRFRVIVAIERGEPASPVSMTLRFFRRREGEPWGAEDPNDYLQEDVMYIDVGEETAPGTNVN